MSRCAHGTVQTAAIKQWFAAHIPAFPEMQARAQAELDSVVGRDRLPAPHDEKNLPYTRAIIKEIERVHNPFWLGTPHMSTEDFTYRGMFIPKNTVVIINAVSLPSFSSPNNCDTVADTTDSTPSTTTRSASPSPRSSTYALRSRSPLYLNTKHSVNSPTATSTTTTPTPSLPTSRTRTSATTGCSVPGMSSFHLSPYLY